MRVGAQNAPGLVFQALGIAAVRIIGTGLGVLVTVLIARLAGAEVLGVYAYCVSVMLLCSVPVAYGWATLIMRGVARQGALLGTHFVMSRMGGVAALCISISAGLFAYVLLQTDIGGPATALQPVAVPALAILGVILLCDQISALRLSILRGLQRVVVAQLPEMLLRPTVLCGLLLAFWSVRGGGSLTIVGCLSALAIAASSAAIAGQLILRRTVVQPPPEAVNRATRCGWIRSAAILAGSAGLVQLNGLADTLILAAYVPLDQIGIYRVALQISMLANFGYIALNMLAGPRFGAAIRRGDRLSLARTTTTLARLALVAALPVPILLGLVGDRLMSEIFGAEFARAQWPALLISLGFVISSAMGMGRTLLVMDGQEKLVMVLTALSLALNVGFSFMLIPAFGILGAAAANFLALSVWNIALWVVARRITGIDTGILGLASNRIS